MKTNLLLRFSLVLTIVALFIACKKETSLENGLSAGAATGELVDSLGYCKRADVQGVYKIDTPLVASSNYVTINVNFTSQGKYKIYSDTVNGMWFIDSGFTVTTGPTTVRLKGYGMPILPKVTDFSLFFLNTLCAFSVKVDGSVAGGTTGTKGDYFPTTSGSTFDYAYNPAINGITALHVGVGVGLVTDGTLNYAQFGISPTDTFYFAKDGAGNYYAFSTIDFDYTLAFDVYPTNYISYPFLKENNNIGEAWTTPEYGPVTTTNGVKGMAKAVFTIEEKGGVRTVPATTGKTYTNVINVKRIIMFKPDGGSYSNFLEGNSYYAKNYGLIDQVIKTTPVQNVSLTAEPVIK